jgi:hypothetical protein
MDSAELRTVVLQMIEELSKQHRLLQSGSVLQPARSKLGLKGIEDEQALLAFFYSLFRTGYLSWGGDLANPNPPFFHVTALGRDALAHHSRDPVNPEGYISHLRATAGLDPVTESYIREGLQTFNTGCFKATAVMVGAAAENIVLDIREALLDKLRTGTASTKNLEDWRVKRILDAIEAAITARKSDVPKPLFERFEANWPAFTYQIRTARNDAGHPISVEPVTPDEVHGSLLIFPQLAALASELKAWIKTGLV